MAFKNEYIPPLEQETSEFLKKVRKLFRIGYKKNDAWTVDRKNNRAVVRTGRGHEIEDHDNEFWHYLDDSGHYSFTTKMIHIDRVSIGPPKQWVVTREILTFWGGKRYSGLPDSKTIKHIKEAFDAHGAHSMATKNDMCLHTLLWKGKSI